MNKHPNRKSLKSSHLKWVFIELFLKITKLRSSHVLPSYLNQGLVFNPLPPSDAVRKQKTLF